LREFTTLFFIEVSLSPGEYRIQVIPHDLLDRPSEPSEWRYFLILPVPIPELEIALDPEWEREREREWEQELEIAREQEREQELQRERELQQERELQREREIERERAIEREREIVRAQELQREREIERERELEREREPRERGITFAPLRSTLISVGAFWSPILPIYGFAFEDNNPLLGAGVHASAIFLLGNNIYIGPEMVASITGDPFTFSAGLNLLAMKWLPNERVGFGVRLGAGYLYFPESEETRSELDEEGNMIDVVYVIPASGEININAGVFLRWRITNRFLLEGGFDFSHIFSDPYSGAIRPWLGVGFQF
jgi:hypothetical protein